MNYTLIGFGALAYLGLGVAFLVRSWVSFRRHPFASGSPFEPLAILLWPILPSLWWPWPRRRRPNPDGSRPPTGVPESAE